MQWENIVHMATLIDAAKGEGRALVVVEQNLAFAELVADRYLVIEQGRVALAGRRGEIDRADAARAPAGVAGLQPLGSMWHE